MEKKSGWLLYFLLFQNAWVYIHKKWNWDLFWDCDQGLQIAYVIIFWGGPAILLMVLYQSNHAKRLLYQTQRYGPDM